VCAAALAAACGNDARPPSGSTPLSPTGGAAPEPTVAEAERFVEQLERGLLELWIHEERVAWVKATYITDDTDILAARASEILMEFVGSQVDQADRFDEIELPKELRRKLDLLILSLDITSPNDADKRREIADLEVYLESTYGKGKHCKQIDDEQRCLVLHDLSEILAKSRDYDELLDAWQGWHAIAPPMRDKYARFVELTNEGARNLGYADLGQLWRSRYDMPAGEFQVELEQLYAQVAPMYRQLHCHVRARLVERYGEERVPPTGPIPAHLLGNMWAQDWSHIFDLVAPEKKNAFDLTALLEQQEFDEVKMVRQAESFFVSLGLDPLPQTFWERSMFKRPADREVVCHASAWNIDWKDDLRIKMCIDITEDEFVTIHHELGHLYYGRAYQDQPPLFTDSANDGFHEAIGDVIALSVTPKYLVQAGLKDEEPEVGLNALMRRALDKISFLPFGLVVDRWRWDVFGEKVKKDRYNAHWWQLRKQYQGVVPPVPRTEADFDPGAKYHIPANVPYTRYFLASILQFQLHRSLCQVAGHEGPLHTCSIYGSKEVGTRLEKMMALGASKPWPDALEALTGEREMDATAIVDYFQPLTDWLAEQNKDRKCGW
jgi:peptidyl-dipeptidase A